MAKKKGNRVAAAAAAAATAAVNASLEESGKVLLFSHGDDDDDDEELADEIMEGLAQIDETAAGEIVWWELYCDAPMDKAGMVRKLGTTELKGLREECLSLGPGEYHVIARTKRGTFVKGSRQKIKISGFARSQAAAPSSPASDPMLLMQQIEERAERRRSAERDRRNTEIKFWAPILAPIGLEFAKGLFGRSGGESMKDLVAALVGMKGLMGDTGGSTQLDTLLKGIELARDLEPASNGKGSTWPDVLVNGLTGLAKEFRPLAESLAARRNGTAAPQGQLQFKTAPLPAGAAAPALTSTPASAETTQPPAQEDNPMLAMVQPLLRKLGADLEDFAVNGADPGLAAEALLAKIPRTFRSMVQPEQFKEWLMLPNWWDLTVAFQPSLQPYQGFCDDVRLSLLEQLEPRPPDGEHEG